MSVALRRTGTLEDLDAELRRAWLECCGHMSAFTIGRERYKSQELDVPIEQVLRPGLKFSYEYDFGTTTELELKVDGEGEIDLGRQTARIGAKNAMPSLKCNQCDKADAVTICSECECQGEGLLCKACAKKHECDEEMFLPVVNSPRMGMCGYTGE